MAIAPNVLFQYVGACWAGKQKQNRKLHTKPTQRPWDLNVVLINQPIMELDPGFSWSHKAIKKKQETQTKGNVNLNPLRETNKQGKTKSKLWASKAKVESDCRMMTFVPYSLSSLSSFIGGAFVGLIFATGLRWLFVQIELITKTRDQAKQNKKYGRTKMQNLFKSQGKKQMVLIIIKSRPSLGHGTSYVRVMINLGLRISEFLGASQMGYQYRINPYYYYYWRFCATSRLNLIYACCVSFCVSPHLSKKCRTMVSRPIPNHPQLSTQPAPGQEREKVVPLQQRAPAEATAAATAVAGWEG